MKKNNRKHIVIRNSNKITSPADIKEEIKIVVKELLEKLDAIIELLEREHQSTQDQSSYA